MVLVSVTLVADVVVFMDTEVDGVFIGSFSVAVFIIE